MTRSMTLFVVRFMVRPGRKMQTAAGADRVFRGLGKSAKGIGREERGIRILKHLFLYAHKRSYLKENGGLAMEGVYPNGQREPVWCKYIMSGRIPLHKSQSKWGLIFVSDVLASCISRVVA